MQAKGMVFCRYCGHQIHESAPACPRCGAVQNPAAQPASKAGVPGAWMAICALICAILACLALLNDGPPDRDTTVGLLTFQTIAIVFGTVSVRNHGEGKKMAVAALLIAVLSLLVLIGKFNR